MTEISFHPGNRPKTCYVSDTLVYEEALDSTRLIGLYWSASGQVHKSNVSDVFPGLNPLVYPLQVFELEIDGQELHNHWELISTSERAGKRTGTHEAVVELQHQIRPVTVKVITHLDGTPFIVRYLEITNTGNAPAALSKVSPLSGMLWSSDARLPDQHIGLLPSDVSSPYTLGYYSGLTQGTEGSFVWETLPKGIRRIEGTNGRSGFGGPYFIVRNEITGECAMGALAWSGNWYAQFWNDPHVDTNNYPDKGFRLAFSMGPKGHAPLRVIAPGETITSPEMHLGMLHADFDTCIQSMHKHLRASVIPTRPKSKEMFVIAGNIVEEPGDWILKEIDMAAEMGVEAFMVDANWYGDKFIDWRANRGDWEEGDWITGGLAACRERAHNHGMLFGLWMEPEEVGPCSKLHETHPDWFLKTDDNKNIGLELDPLIYGHNSKDLTLDLANPEAAAYMCEWIIKVIETHKLDFFKIDYNFNVYEGGQHIYSGYAEHESWRHYETIYGLAEKLRKMFPDVALENCASGGGRNDLGMISRFDYSSISDYGMYPRNIRAINGMTIFLPPEILCYYHNMQWAAHQMADLDTQLRVLLFAQNYFVGFGSHEADLSTAFFDKTKRYIDLAKKFTEPILASHPDVYHHTPHIGLQSPADWCVLEYVKKDKSEGYAGIFRLGAGTPVSPTSNEYLFIPRGLDSSTHYEITLDNKDVVFEKKGSELMLSGIQIHLDGPYTSELILFKKCKKSGA